MHHQSNTTEIGGNINGSGTIGNEGDMFQNLEDSKNMEDRSGVSSFEYSNVNCDSDTNPSEIESYSKSETESEAGRVEQSDHENEIPIPLQYDTEENNSPTMEIRRLAIKHCWTRGTIRDVALFVRELGHDVPSVDARTILKTSRIPLNDKHFQYFGLVEGLGHKLHSGLKDNSTIIHLQGHIDGIAIHRKSNRSLWPISVRIINCIDDIPFAVACHCGKPTDIERYLIDFVCELFSLQTRGATYNGIKFEVNIDSLVLDAQARSMVKCVAGCGATNGCERCCVKGKKICRRMNFKSQDSTLRTDKSFREQRDPAHHKGKSPFLKIKKDMIKLFPLDSMHLVYLGVVKRFIDILNGNPLMGKKLKAGKLRHKNKTKRGNTDVAVSNSRYLSNNQKKEMNDLIMKYSKNLPREFNRKGQRLDNLSNWKAV